MANKKLKRSNRKTRRNNRRKNSRANRRGLAFASRKSRRASRRSRRSMRGGSYLEALSRPFFAGVYPSSLQNTYSTYTGAQPNNYPGSPAADNKSAPHSWNYDVDPNAKAIDPSRVITPINTGYTLMAGPAPYSPNMLNAPGAGVSAGTASASGTSAFADSASVGVGQTSIAANMRAGIQGQQSFN